MVVTRSLLRIPDAGAPGRIFCFPYSGVGASMFSRWPRWIGDYEVCPLQLPGRENRIAEDHYGTYHALADELSVALRPYLDRPSVFFGHCAGALPAFETARRCADVPEPPRLVVSAQVAPHDCPHDRFLECTDAQLRDELGRLTRSRGGAVDASWLDLAMSILHKDLAANRLYWLDEPVHTGLDISVLHWSDDAELTGDQLAGWAHYGTDVRFDVLAGEHYEFLTAPGVLLDHLAGWCAGDVAR